jgi:16S rRNA C1402 N4-methylase RsmH
MMEARLAARALADLADREYDREMSQRIEQLREENPNLTTEELAAKLTEYKAERQMRKDELSPSTKVLTDKNLVVP